MALKIRVKNFQSLEDASIVVDGFTAITGPNNSGKSALFRAVRGLFSNTWNDTYVRQGAKFATVEITFPDGRTLKWEKGKGVNNYYVNGVNLGLVGKGVPDEVTAFGVRPLMLGPDKVWPQIAQQLTDVVFLLNSPGDRIAEAVSDFHRVTSLSNAMKLGESDRRKVSDTLKTRKDDLVKVESDLEFYAGVEGVVTDINGLVDSWARASKLRNDILATQELSQKLHVATNAVLVLMGVTTIELPPQEACDRALAYQAEVSWLTGQKRAVETCQKATKQLEFCTHLSLPDCSQSEATLQDLKDLLSLRDQHVAATREQKKIQVVVDCLRSLGLEGFEVTAKGAYVAVQEIQTLYTLASKVRESHAQVVSVQKEVELVRKELTSVEQDVKDLLGQMQVCPTCGQECSTC